MLLLVKVIHQALNVVSQSVSQSISDFMKWPKSLHCPRKCYRHKDCCSQTFSTDAWRTATW